MKKILKNATTDALAAAAYVAAVGLFLFYAPGFLGQARTPLLPVVLLLLFVFSAALTGALIFGRPALWYMEGKKKEALSLLGFTLGIFLIAALFALSALYLLK